MTVHGNCPLHGGYRAPQLVTGAAPVSLLGNCAAFQPGVTVGSAFGAMPPAATPWAAHRAIPGHPLLSQLLAVVVVVDAVEVVGLDPSHPHSVLDHEICQRSAVEEDYPHRLAVGLGA